MKLAKLINVPILACALGFAFLAGYNAQNRLEPSAIAMLDLEKVFNSINENATTIAELNRMKEEYAKQNQIKHDEIIRMNKELEDFQAGSPSYQALSEKVESALGSYAAYTEFANRKLARMESDSMLTSYLRIRDFVKQYAKDRGIDAVFLDDTIPQIERGSGESVLQQISSRRMLYANPARDISDEIIEAMNAAFDRAAGG